MIEKYQTCGRCYASKTLEHYALKPNGTYMKTCDPCREKKRASYRATPKVRVTRGPEQLGGDPKYLRLLSKPLSELADH